MKKTLATLATVLVAQAILAQEDIVDSHDLYNFGYETTLSLKIRKNYTNVFLGEGKEKQILTSINMSDTYNIEHHFKDVNNDGYTDIIIRYQTNNYIQDEIFENMYAKEPFSWKQYGVKQLLDTPDNRF